MKYSLGLALVIVGVALLVVGIHSTNSLGSSFSRLFTGAPTDKAVWFLVGGLGISAMGAALLGRRTN